MPKRQPRPTLAQWFERCKWKCFYCGIQLRLGTAKIGRRCAGIMGFDHVIPGIESVDNLVASCTQCNGRKRNLGKAELEMLLRRINAHVKKMKKLGLAYRDKGS